MIYKYLPILLLLVSGSAHAKYCTNIYDSSEQIAKTFYEEKSSDQNAAIYSPYGGWNGSGGGGGGVHFFYSIDLGYVSISSKGGGANYTSGGFMYKGELGAKIVLRGRNPNRTGLLSISAFASGFSNKQKTTDPLGNSETQTIDYSVIGLPISYTSMGYGRNGTGFYWQIGVNTNYLYDVTNNGNTVTNQYNNIYFEPSVSFGLSTPFHVINRHTGGEVGHGRALLGPFFQDVVTNLSKASGVSIRSYSIGLRYAYVFM